MKVIHSQVETILRFGAGVGKLELWGAAPKRGVHL